MILVQWATHYLPMWFAKQLQSLVEFQALQTQAELQLHSADQAAIVRRWACSNIDTQITPVLLFSNSVDVNGVIDTKNK